LAVSELVPFGYARRQQQLTRFLASELISHQQFLGSRDQNPSPSGRDFEPP
jgi:hypothetical protein